MVVSNKDLIAAIIIVCLTVLVAFGRVSFEVVAPVLSLIIGYYFGYEHGVVVERVREKRV